MSRRKCTSAIALGAIVFLCALVVTVWVQFSQGAFDRKPSHSTKNHVIFVSHPTSTTTMSTVVKNDEHLGLSAPKDLLEKTHLDENLGSQKTMLIKPLKINPDDEHPPMEPLDGPIERHHSGHFRHQSAEIWDPHPKYKINAFGRSFVLQLEQNDKFLAPVLHIVTHGKDFAHLRQHDPKISGCFYTGKIQNDSNSAVAVNLCHGMTGYIRSSWANYYIEPAENFTSGSLDTILHRIKIVPHMVPENHDFSKFNRNYTENGSDSIIEDDFPEDILESHHSIKKRYATYSDGTLRDFKGYIKSSQEYFVKVLIVTDWTMLNHHQSSAELTKYIMILMSYVALLFKEPSIGNAINVSLVDIRILDYDVHDITTSKSTDIIQKFCDWKHQNIKTNIRHDIALLLTRQPICKAADSCSTLGVAQVSSMCEDNSCTVVRDKGLSTAYTIAHEFGHALSMLHDEDTKCANLNPVKPHNNNIMSRSTSNDSKPFMWSNCSRHFVTDFLDSPKSKCLHYRPSHEVIFSNYTQTLPGDNFELDRQCELEFGAGQTSCKMTHFHILPCVHMWCKNFKGEGCINNYSPWAEGTKCGHDMLWCYKRQCVPQNRSNIQPIDGGWSDWQPWGNCTRACGGGIMKSVRLCNSPIPANGGKYCTGESVRYSSCNYQNCENDTDKDFREKQCSEFDNITRGVPNLSQDVKWVPKYGVGLSERSEDQCRLYCKPKGSQAYYSLKEKVTDGTKCGLSGFDICVNGICRPGGCDNILDSKKTNNKCGICGGDDSQCIVINGTYNTIADQVTYKHVVRIPKDSTNIEIIQYSAGVDENFLALKDGETQQYILNGNQMLMTQEMEIEYGRVLVKYSGSRAKIERITTTNGQVLQKDLIVEVLSIKNLSPPNITFQYMIRKEAAPTFGWNLYQKGWTKCSSVCEGFQYKKPVCVNLVTNTVVHSSYCNLDEKDSATQKRECNTHCTLRWHAVSKSACSPPCRKGYRQVHYQCMKLFKNKQYNAEIVEDQHCHIHPKPPTTEACYTLCENGHWTYSDWSECSQNCGGGIRRRTVLNCVDENDNPIDESYCKDFPQLEEQCNLHICLTWLKHTSPCSVPCGGGHQNITYYCSIDNQVVTDSQKYCDVRNSPTNTTLPCNEHSCARWAATNYFYPCSVTCGEGVERRRYVCKKFDSDEEVDQEYCRSLRRPREDTRKCFRKCAETPFDTPRFNDIQINQNRHPNHMRHYRTFQWIPGEWSQCSQTCDGGIITQSFTCQNEMGDENILMCDPHKKPHNIARCNDQPCPIWKVGDWSPVCDLKCERHRQVRCMNEKMETFDDRQCDQQNRPGDTIKCRPDECPHSNGNYTWKVEPWKECSTKCGIGVRRRVVKCYDPLRNEPVKDAFCKHKSKPKASKGCERYKCKYTWVQGHWSSCSATCGYGTQTRNVACHKVYQGIVNPNPETYEQYCDLNSKPSMIGRCLLSNCRDEYVWKTGEWQQCSKSCGKKGRQIRKLYCINARWRTGAPQHFCPKSLRPIRKRKCNQKRCLYESCMEIKRHTNTRENKDYLILLHGNIVKVYCYKMDTSEPEEYISLHPGKQNFAEIYDRRLLNLNSCPYGGNRLDSCQCDQIGPYRSGTTIFWKVRLNITSMQIISDDFTFSKQVKGMKIPYGTSGDCYSSTSVCPQGKFSVDLTHTSFKLANNNKWRKTGRYPSMSIKKIDPFAVSGKCGGYCGGCEPDPDYGGLKVEIT